MCKRVGHAFYGLGFLVYLQLTATLAISINNSSNIDYEGTENVDDPCESFRCENNGQCMTIVSERDGNETKHAECACHDRWIGPRCESLLILSPRRITEFSVELRVSVQKTNTSQWQEEKYLKYTLQYWSNDSDTSCYKIPEITNLTYEISDLTSGVFYHFCARTDIVAKCATNSKDPLGLGSNCIGIVTRLPRGEQENNAKGTLVPVLPIVISVILLVTAVTALAVVFKCGYSLFKECGCSLYRTVQCCCRQNRKPAYDLFILPDNACANVNNQTPLIADSSQTHLQNPQCLTSLTQASVSAHATPTFFPLATDRNLSEQNPERMLPLMSQTNAEVAESEPPDFIQICS